MIVRGLARHVVEHPALDQRIHARVANQHERGAVVVAARVARDLPPLREQLLDGQRRRLGGCHAETPSASSRRQEA